MTGSPLQLLRLAKRYGAATVLDGLNLEVEPGSFLAVVGRSGTGKSTLLRLILGLETSSGGEVIGPTPNEARLMFQEPRLLPWATVLANVEVGSGEARDPDRARAALAAVGLEGREGDWPETLSGGQRQRVALARALVSSPRFLALDEPLGALDALTRIEMQALLERVWRDQGFTAVLVTHDVSEAVSLADRVIVLQDGVISLDLTVDLPRPRERGSLAFARLEQRLLDKLLTKAA